MDDLLQTVKLLTDRDRRIYQWLLETVGEEAIRDAITHLPPGQQPYVSNLCRALGQKPPRAVSSDKLHRAQPYLEQIRRLLHKKSE
ncbi:hypothetical protein BUE93_20475 [Chromobacterium amazonense]|uniref:Uncharacterized protein n=1 Tax=Chromobacterium amazonense TaxID=1382803 RepID=A0A2S9WZC5_9NEIS|nr:hypothetical protein [Chromobacterium amazonense]PRP68825.1 hypothetical protein BUE93_20475 [Chromobacterium amazonense]